MRYIETFHTIRTENILFCLKTEIMSDLIGILIYLSEPILNH